MALLKSFELYVRSCRLFKRDKIHCSSSGMCVVSWICWEVNIEKRKVVKYAYYEICGSKTVCKNRCGGPTEKKNKRWMWLSSCMILDNTLHYNGIALLYSIQCVGGRGFVGIVFEEDNKLFEEQLFWISIRKAVHSGSGDNDEYVRRAGNVVYTNY